MNNSIETGDQRAKEIKDEDPVPEEDDKSVYGVTDEEEGDLNTIGNPEIDEMLTRADTGEDSDEGYDFSNGSGNVIKSDGSWRLGARPSDPFNDEEY